MHITIIGAGAMGTLFGGLLADAGHAVTLAVRNSEITRHINTMGLHITGASGDMTAEATAVSDTTALPPQDMVLMAVKSYDTAAAVDMHRGALTRSQCVLTLQNGLGNAEAIADAIGPATVLAGTTTIGANLLAPGEVHHAGDGDTYIGPLDPAGMPLAEMAQEIFAAAGIFITLSPDIMTGIWQKVCINAAINPLTALLAVRNGVLEAHAPGRAIMDRIVEETVGVAAAEGVTLDMAALRQRAHAVARNTGDNRSSMLMDVLHRRRTEIADINGAIARLAADHGLAAPVNETLASLIKIIETGIPRETL